MKDFLYRTQIHTLPVDEVIKLVNKNGIVRVRSKSGDDSYIVSPKYALDEDGNLMFKKYTCMAKHKVHKLKNDDYEDIIKKEVIAVVNGGMHNTTEVGIFGYLISEKKANKIKKAASRNQSKS